MDEQRIRSLTPTVNAVEGHVLAAIQQLSEMSGLLHASLDAAQNRVERTKLHIERLAGEARQTVEPPPKAETPVGPVVPPAAEQYLWIDPPPLSKDRPVGEHQVYAELWERRNAVFRSEGEDKRSAALFSGTRGYVPRAMHEIAAAVIAVKPAEPGMVHVQDLMIAAENKVWMEKVHAGFEQGLVELAGDGTASSNDPFLKRALHLLQDGGE